MGNQDFVDKTVPSMRPLMQIPRGLYNVNYLRKPFYSTNIRWLQGV